MEKSSDLIITLKNKITDLAEKYRIAYAILFGSSVYGRLIKGESDIDLAVKIRGLNRNESYSFLKRFINELDVNRVDLIIINFAPFSIKYDILTKGKIVFCKDSEELFEDRLRVIKLKEDWNNFSKIFEEREVRKVIG
ncbi:MAG: nucleotidyltransferase domain-containing protein [Nitrososphaeria archaeon]|nr:nucleotidyltransferase domain-containing protein [Nitrososphaeria archaeon]